MNTVTERVRKIERLQAEAEELHRRLKAITDTIDIEIERLPGKCLTDVFVCLGSGFKIVNTVDDGRRPLPHRFLKRHSILIEGEQPGHHCPACNGKLDPTNLQFCGHCNWQDDSLDIDAAIDRGHAMDAEEP